MEIYTDKVQQQKAVVYVGDTFKEYKDLLDAYYTRLLSIYKELNTFTYPKKNEWNTEFKVNKMHEVSNKILPRIVSRSPKWIISIKPDVVNSKINQGEDVGNLELQALAVQDLLSTTFDKYNLQEPTRLRAKSMVNYGVGRAKVTTKYDITRTIENLAEPEIETVVEDGEEKQIEIKSKITEKVANQYVTIEPISRADMYYDPRYIMFSDMPAVIRVTNNIRLGQVKKEKKYKNIDMLEGICNLDKSQQQYKEAIQAITGLQLTDTPTIDKNNLTVYEYYGYYDLKGDERLYKITTVNNLVCVEFEEITQIPFEQIRCFEDTETNISVGYLEAIMGLQKELNYKKNSASEYINKALNRSWIWSPNSGINPKKLIDKPNNIIATTKSAEEAMRNLTEIPHRTLDPGYFQEQNDFERQIQGLTFTVDTNNSANQQGLTNTATGIRIKFFESNVVTEEVRKHFEQGLERLAYKLLQEIYENMDQNITIKQLGDDGFWEINKEAIRNALAKFEIKIEAGTSSYETIENRREDALARFNILQNAAKAGLQIDLEEGVKDVLNTFEGVTADKYIKRMPMVGMGLEGLSPIQQPEQSPSNPAAITEQVAKGGITEGL